LPHSDICGSNRLCRSPQLFAAWHVLLRLREPRHSPYALVHLNIPPGPFCKHGGRLGPPHAQKGTGGPLHFPLNMSKNFSPPSAGDREALPKQKQTKPHKAFQKGGVPAAPSGTATLLRLSPSHRFYPKRLLAVTVFRSTRLPWLDGRCVQGPGTYSPRRG
jgi:hypothetical protein